MIIMRRLLSERHNVSRWVVFAVILLILLTAQTPGSGGALADQPAPAGSVSPMQVAQQPAVVPVPPQPFPQVTAPAVTPQAPPQAQVQPQITQPGSGDLQIKISVEPETPAQPPAGSQPFPPVQPQSQPVAEPGPSAAPPFAVQPAPPSPPQPQAVAPVQVLPQPPVQPGQPTAPEPAQPQSQLTQPSPQTPSDLQAPARPPTRRPGGLPIASAGSVRGQFSFNFDDADIYSVIQTVFGDVLRVNYVVDPRVKGRVTFRSVAPVPGDNVLPLMEVILRLNGIAVVEDSGLYRIIPLGEVAREPSSVGFGRDSKKVPSTGKALLQVIPINYMSSSEMVKLVTPFLSAGAIVVDVPKINHIIIVDTDASVKRVLALVDIFDSEQQKRKRPQVFVHAVQNGKAKDITALLQQIFLGARGTTPTQPERTSGPGSSTTAYPSAAPPSTAAPMFPSSPSTTMPQPQAGGISGGAAVLISSEITRIFSNDVTNSIIVLATPEDFQIIKEAIEKIDIVPRQVVIEGIIAQVTLTDNLSLGIAWAFKAKSGDLKGLISLDGAALSAIDAVKTSGTGFTFTAVDDQGMVRALVTALASESKGRVLAAPHILVSDNHEARIQVGQSVPIVTAQTYGTPGIAPQQVIEYKDIGIILKVKPQVNESGLVALDIHQEVSTFTTQKLFVDSTQIILNKTEASSSLVVQDGQTIIIGGLIREDTTKSISGIPYLSKIPLLGYLFGGRERDVSRTEIIMLLTPRVLRNQKEAKDTTSSYIDKFTERGNIKKEDLQWVRPPAKPDTQEKDTKQQKSN